MSHKTPHTTQKRKGTFAEDVAAKKHMSAYSVGPFTDFLQTRMIILSTKDSEIQFKIHTGLLKSKCFSFYQFYIEKATSTYVCIDTQASILSALVGWAYTREYPDRNDLQKSDIKCATNHDESAECKVAASILNDIHLYVFCDKYDIPALGSLAVTHMKKTMAGMGDSRIHMSMAFIPAARLALSKFKESNPLLSYFAHFAAYHIENLRCSGSFCTLLSDHPNFAFSILHYAGPAKEKPE
ncbi:uncharacterized protein BO96DRAFT_498895 [Aspergillus niger CBS 101883]|uniref:uncharacterized protein n=1 Tax=Aspergillus lacticoffeatus (strain CBS 101883) TaxID=1450533 RepID=UPI000D7EDE47|nr:uncharacterized protein BO96DRAFT_498895 [Aspergillus niger CBS 101883]PYH58526.1 hypothetical protein BO96DRAFT_498895 [Aspergillus niger CBS 101883]